MFEELLTLLAVNPGWAAWLGSVVGGSLDRLILESVEPVLKRSRNNTVAISQRVYLARLLTANRCENTFPRLLFVDLVFGARRVLRA